jgi:SAM-dependent methyltransferase
MKRLNLGCGRDILDGWVNLDLHALPGVDVVHDLTKLPLPFGEQEFDEVRCISILEHLDYVPLLCDIHRVLRPDGRLMIHVPHYTSRDSFVDPTHIKLFSVRTFEFFLEDSEFQREYYFNFKFRRLAERRLTFHKRSPLFYNWIVEPLVNLHPRLLDLYERSFLSALFPASSLECTLLK